MECRTRLDPRQNKQESPTSDPTEVSYGHEKSFTFEEAVKMVAISKAEPREEVKVCWLKRRAASWGTATSGCACGSVHTLTCICAVMAPNERNDRLARLSWAGIE